MAEPRPWAVAGWPPRHDRSRTNAASASGRGPDRQLFRRRLPKATAANAGITQIFIAHLALAVASKSAIDLRSRVSILRSFLRREIERHGVTGRSKQAPCCA